MQEWEERALDRMEAKSIGRMLTLIMQVQKKHTKGVDADSAADMLEEDPQLIRSLYSLIEEHPGYDEEDIYDLLDESDDAES